MDSSFCRFHFAALKQATPFLACAAAGLAATFWSAAPAVAQTGPGTTQPRYVTAAIRMSSVYDAPGLSTYTAFDVNTIAGFGNRRKDLNAEMLECWTTRLVLHSKVSANTGGYVRNDTDDEVYTQSSPYINIFATGVLNATGGNGDEHDASSAIGIGEAFTSGMAIFPGGDAEYVKSNSCFFKTVYQPNEMVRVAGYGEAEAHSSFPPSQMAFRVPAYLGRLIAQTRNRAFEAHME